MYDTFDALKKGTEAHAARLRGMIDNYVANKADAGKALSAAASSLDLAEKRYRKDIHGAGGDLPTRAEELNAARDAHRAAQERAAAFAQHPANPSDALMGMEGPHRPEAQALEQAAALEMSEHLETVGALCAELEAVLDRAGQLPELIDLARGILPVDMRTNYEPTAPRPRVVLTVNTDAVAVKLRPRKMRGPVALRPSEGV